MNAQWEFESKSSDNALQGKVLTENSDCSSETADATQTYISKLEATYKLISEISQKKQEFETITHE